MPTQQADSGAVVLAVQADVATLYLNRPERLNAVNDQLVEGLLAALAEVEAEQCGAAIIAGRGRAFCAGHDLKAPRGDDAGLFRRLEHLQEVTRRIRRLPIPMIAAVHGHAVGAGAEFALGCDLVIAAEDTRFRFPEVGIGLSATGGLTKLLPLLVGPVKAKDEVERVLQLHPAVKMAAVLPEPDELRGEEVHAVIVASDGRGTPELADIIEHCRRQLAYFKVPRYWTFVADLPLTASERVAKAELRARLDQEGARGTVDRTVLT